MNDSVTHEHRQHETANQSRLPAPEGMTYNRKGVLVKKRAQSARSNKVFLVLQVIDHQGNVIEDMTKKNIRVLQTLRNSDKVLELMDNNDNEGAFYVRVDLAAK